MRACRPYLRDSLAAADGCQVEIILKDTHTCEHQPQRFDRWTKLARQAVVEHMEKQG